MLTHEGPLDLSPFLPMMPSWLHGQRGAPLRETDRASGGRAVRKEQPHRGIRAEEVAWPTPKIPHPGLRLGMFLLDTHSSGLDLVLCQNLTIPIPIW